MNWKDVKDIVGKGVPLLGSLLGGNAGEMAGSLIASALGCEADPDIVADKLRTDPEAYLRLQELEISNAHKLQELTLTTTLKTYEIDHQDRDSARNREAETVKATGKRDWFLYGLAAIFVIGFFILLIILVKTNVVETTMLAMCVGALVNGVGQVLNYFFGSSKSSSEKNAIIAKKG